MGAALASPSRSDFCRRSAPSGSAWGPDTSCWQLRCADWEISKLAQLEHELLSGFSIGMAMPVIKTESLLLLIWRPARLAKFGCWL